MKSRKKIVQLPPTRLGGRYKVRVLNADGSIAEERPWQKNLILNGGIVDADDTNWRQMLAYCRAGSGTAALTSAPDGTYAQSGTAVTRSTGTGTFVAGDVGKHIKWAGGETALITAYVSGTEVTVRESATVSAATITLYNTQETALETQLKSSNTLDAGPSANTDTVNAGAGTMTYKRTYNFTAEVGSVSYNEIGVSRAVSSDLLSRIILASTVNVLAGQQLQVVFELTMTASSYLSATPETLTVTGWPRPYNITLIESDGANLDVTFDEDHHYGVGDTVVIANALPVQVAISTFSSTVSEFTVTTSAVHGLSISDSVVIAGATPGSYDGTWTVAAVDSTTVFRVTSGINPGAGSGGTVRLATPGSWYNGTHTVASIPSSTQVRITTALNEIDAGSGDAEGILDASVRLTGQAPFYEPPGTPNSGHGGILDLQGTSQRFCHAFQEADIKTVNALGNSISQTDGILATRDTTKTALDTTDFSFTVEHVFDIDEANFDDLRQFHFRGQATSYGTLAITFDENQRKDSGYSLTLGYTVTFRQELP